MRFSLEASQHLHDVTLDHRQRLLGRSVFDIVDVPELDLGLELGETSAQQRPVLRVLHRNHAPGGLEVVGRNVPGRALRQGQRNSARRKRS